RRHTRFSRDWSSDVCSSDLAQLWGQGLLAGLGAEPRLSLRGQPERGQYERGENGHEQGRWEKSPEQDLAHNSYAQSRGLASIAEIGRASWRERGEIYVVRAG